MRVLGIDPGSRVTGYGVVELRGREPAFVACGTIRTRGEELAERLKMIYEGVLAAADQYTPEVVALESVFVHRSPASAIKLGQARGAAICAVASRGLPVCEYAPRQIKQAVTGSGSAGKEQVQHMVRLLLHLSAAPASDAADALAGALCHCYLQERLARLDGASRLTRGRPR